jgi:hypothetical protein
MVGGGIFAVLGLSVQITKGAAPVAFLLAGLVALLTARSYALLSKSFPSRGGTVTFVNRAFGSGFVFRRDQRSAVAELHRDALLVRSGVR